MAQWLVALVVALGAAPIAVAPRLAAASPLTLTLQCPRGSHVVTYHEPLDPFELTIAPGIRHRGLACSDAGQQLNGPVLLVRPDTTDGALRLIGAGPWRSDALQWIGQFRDGRPVGTWQQLGPTGNKLAPVVLSADGTGAYVERDGGNVVRVTGALRYGQRDGVWRWSDAQGVQRGEANYVRGKLTGESIVRSATGQPEIHAAWVDNARDGLFTSWWPSGIKRWEGRYVRELRDGRWCNWNDQGQLLGCNDVRLGDGDWNEWNPMGDLVLAGTMRADRRDGVWRLFHDNGALRNETTYANGQVVAGSSHSYEVDGQTAERPRLGILGRRSGGPQGLPPNSLTGRGGVTGGSTGGGVAGGVAGGGSGIGGLSGIGRSAGVRGGATGAGAGPHGLALTVRPVGGVPLPQVIAGTVGLAESMIARCPHGGAPSGTVLHTSWFGRVQASGLLATLSAAPLGHGGTPAPPAWVACAEMRLRAIRFERHRGGAVEILAELRVP